MWLARQGLVVDAFDIAEAGVAKARKLAAGHAVSANFEVAEGSTPDGSDPQERITLTMYPVGLSMRLKSLAP